MKGDVVVGVRPEAWRVVGAEEGGLPVEVTVVEELGADAFVYGTSGVEGTPSNVIVRVSARDTVHKGDVLHVTTDPHNVHVFDAARGSASATDLTSRPRAGPVLVDGATRGRFGAVRVNRANSSDLLGKRSDQACDAERVPSSGWHWQRP